MIRMILLDVDGCLTDGRIIYSEDGNETKAFNVKDGLAIKSWMKLGYEVAIITGRKSEIVRRRANELGIRHLYQGVRDKASLTEELLAKLNIGLDETAAIGDDLNDYRMIKKVGMGFVPQNGSHYIKEIAGTVLQSKGGEGAVREMIEILICANAREGDFLSMWQ